MKPPFKMIIENEIEQYRYDTWESKEPETVDWISSFKDGEAFFDIGANVGVFSLLCASLHPNSQIYAFEPMPKNFIRLLQNVELNGFKNVHCFNVALADWSGFKNIYVPNNEVGQSGTQINGPRNEEGEYFESEIEHLIQHLKFDDFVPELLHGENYHIKIDVDGAEEAILNGMFNELEVLRPESLLLEINESKAHSVFFEWFYDICAYQYCTDNEFNNHPSHSRIRRKKEGIKAENIIFTKV